jgi:hypothetical protein
MGKAHFYALPISSSARLEFTGLGENLPQPFETLATRLIGPDNQRFYHVEDGQLASSPASKRDRHGNMNSRAISVDRPDLS